MPLQASSPRSAAGDRIRANAQWGAACASCASAKAKCIRTNEDPEAKCDRCERLLKECTGQVHKPRKKRASKPSKTAQLEERLNGLVDLLRSTGELPVVDGSEVASPYNPPSVPSLIRDETSAPSSRPSPGAPPESHREPTGVAAAPAAGTRASNIIRSTPPIIPSTYNSFAPPSCICRPEAGETATDYVESDETLLEKFRRDLHPLLPIVALPTYDGVPATAAQLAAGHPCLFLAIKTVASVDNVRSMQGLMYQFINRVADYMLLRAERSLDLLHGLLTMLSWYHHHCMLHAQLGNLLHLATSLACDLNLNRPPRIAERTDAMVLQPNRPNPRTNDERRCLLGVWYLRSSVWHSFQKTEPMQYTPYARQCLQELEDAHELESDDVLVAIIKMQHLSDRVAAINSRDEAIDDLPGYPRAPKAAYRIAFQGELDVLVGSFTAAMKKHHLVQIHVAALKLRLYEPPLLDLALLKKLSGSLASVASPMMATALDALYAARNALISFFDLFLGIPAPSLLWLPLPLYAHVVHATTMLSRWARLIGPVRPLQAANALAKGADADSRSGAGVQPSASAAYAAPDRTASTASQPGAGSRASASASASASGASGPSGASGIPVVAGVDSRDLQRDPSLHAAVARMREHLRQQPDLVLDIPGMLTAIWDRFEQSNHHMRSTSAAKFGDPVSRGMNAWDLTARKIAVMRFKVGRYLDGSASTEGDGCGGNGGGGSGSGTAGDPRRASRPTQQPTMASAQQPDEERHPSGQQGQGGESGEEQAHHQPAHPYSQHVVPCDHEPAPHQYQGYPHPHPHPHHLSQQQQQQQPDHLPMHNLAFSVPSPSPRMDVGMPPTAIPPPVFGLPPDLGSYVMNGVGAGIFEELSYGLGNMEGWEVDAPWAAETLANSADHHAGTRGDGMGWGATATQLL